MIALGENSGKNSEIVTTRMYQHTINRKQSKSQKVYTAYNGLA